MRLAWPPPWHLTASVLISILVLGLVHLSPELFHDFSVPLGLILVIFIPGYLLVLAIFPAGSDLTGKRRTLLSLGFDAILTVLVCLILVLTPRGLQPASLATILSLLSLFLCAVAHARWSAFPRRRRFVILSNSGFRTSKALARATRGKGKRSAVHFALLLVAIFAIAAFAYAINMYQVYQGTLYQGTRDDAGFTEFHVSLLRWSDDASLKAGSPVTVQAQIINHENRAIDYTLWLLLNGSTVLRKNLTLSRNETWRGPVSFILNGQAGGHRLDFLLFEDYDYSAPSQEDHLWINLSENKSMQNNSMQNTTSDKNSSVTDEQRGKVSILSASKGGSQVDYQPSGGGVVSASTGKSSKSSSKMTQESRTIQENSSVQSSSQEEEAQGQSSPSSPDEVFNSTTESLKEDRTINDSNANKTYLSFSKTNLANQTASSAANISGSMEEEIENLSLNLPPDIDDFYPDVHSPQTEGTTVLWTAEASDPDGDPIYYRFILNGMEMTDWSTDSSWTWDTSQAAPGDYKIGVLARDGKHASEDAFDDSMDVSFTLLAQNHRPVLQELKPDAPSPQESGTSIAWTALAKDPDGDPIYYRFILNGMEMTDWSTDSSWTWDTSQAAPGDYKIGVLARDGKHASEDAFDDSMDVSFTLLAQNHRPVLQELKPDAPSPQESGTSIAWTALAKDPDGDPIYYRFILNGMEMTDWSTDSSWTWDTSQAAPGDYKIGVLARDGKHASEDAFDDSMDVSFTLLAQNQPPALLNLTPDKPSPQVRGTTVVWKADASDPDGDIVLYRFLVDNKARSLWSQSDSWSWSTANMPDGNYHVSVQVRDGRHAGEESFDGSLDQSFTLISEIDQQIDQIMKNRTSYIHS